MIHPLMTLRWISDIKGHGLVATGFIPKGTITFAQDPLDIKLHVSDPLLRDKRLKPYIEKYSYLNQHEEFVISWDGGKYMNHCCFANTLTTGYGFEIAIRDIEPGEEVTDDYGIFTIRHEMTISCGKENCRGRVSIDDFDKCVAKWDEQVISALGQYKTIEQPLLPFVEQAVIDQIDDFLTTGNDYVSVVAQRADPEKFSFWTGET